MKILEAAAARCPVLTTRTGLEGLDLISGEHVTAVPCIADLNEAILNCLDYPERAAGRAIYAKTFVRERYDWSVIAPGLAASWQSAIDGFTN